MNNRLNNMNNNLALIADAAERFAARDNNVEWRENGIPEEELRNIAETHGRGNDPGAIGMMRVLRHVIPRRRKQRRFSKR